MTLMTDNDWVRHLDMSEPTHCKYPHEWQFIVSGSQVDVAYYSAQNDVQGHTDIWQVSNCP